MEQESSQSTFDPEVMEDSRLVCEICEHLLIEAVDTTCGHTFCIYCLYMWKKYSSICPSCGQDSGKISTRPDIDYFIDHYFKNANSLAQAERTCFLQTRQGLGKPKDLEKVLFSNRSLLPVRSTVIDQGGHIRGKTPQRTNVNPGISTSRDNLAKLNKETSKLEKDLVATYSRILTLGESITQEEDTLAPQYFDPNSKKGFLTNLKVRPTTSVTSSVLSTVARPQDKVDVDDLLDQTDEMIKIEWFLKKYSIDLINKMDDDEAIEIHQAAVHDISEIKMKDNPVKCQSVALNSNSFSTKIHPAVEEFLRKAKIKTKIIPRPPQKKQNLMKSINSTPREVSIPIEPPEETFTELHRCRESLLKMKDAYNGSHTDIFALREEVKKIPSKTSLETLSSTTSCPKLAHKPLPLVKGKEVQKPNSTPKPKVGSGVKSVLKKEIPKKSEVSSRNSDQHLTKVRERVKKTGPSLSGGGGGGGGGDSKVETLNKIYRRRLV